MARVVNSGLLAGPHHARRYAKRQTPLSGSEASGGTQPPVGTGTDADEALTLPEGTTRIEDILKWVGTDPQRAQVALSAETSKPEKHQRKTLIADLTDLVLGD